MEKKEEERGEGEEEFNREIGEWKQGRREEG